MAKIVLNKDECIQCGACSAASEEEIKMDDEGYPIEGDVSDAEKANAGVEACPVGCIKVE